MKDIVISQTPPAIDKLWLRQTNDGITLNIMLNGVWTNLLSNISKELDTDLSEIRSEVARLDGRLEFLTKDAPENLDTLKEIADKIGDFNFDEIEMIADKVSFYSDNTNLSSASTVKDAIELIANKAWYTQISISSFTSSPSAGTYEVGKVLSSPITLSWATSKAFTKAVLSGAVSHTTTDPSVKSYKYTSSISTNKTFTLTVTEAEGKTAAKSLSFTFKYALYQGMAEIPSSYTSSWVKSTLRGKALADNWKSSFTVKASTTKYWWFVYPKSWGTASFKTSLGDTTMVDVIDIDDFVNDEGVTVPMKVLRFPDLQNSDVTLTGK